MWSGRTVMMSTWRQDWQHSVNVLEVPGEGCHARLFLHMLKKLKT